MHQRGSQSLHLEPRDTLGRTVTRPEVDMAEQIIVLSHKGRLGPKVPSKQQLRSQQAAAGPRDRIQMETMEAIPCTARTNGVPRSGLPIRPFVQELATAALSKHLGKEWAWKDWISGGRGKGQGVRMNPSKWGHCRGVAGHTWALLLAVICLRAHPGTRKMSR